MRRMIAATLMLGIIGAAYAASPAEAPPAAGSPSAAQIVERVIAARGGVSAWQNLRSMTWKGKLGAGATTYEVVTKGQLETKQRDETMLPFTFEYKRPVKTRL